MMNKSYATRRTARQYTSLQHRGHQGSRTIEEEANLKAGDERILVSCDHKHATEKRRTPAIPSSFVSVMVRMNGGRLSSSSKSSSFDLYWPCSSGAGPRDGCGETAVSGSDGEVDIVGDGGRCAGGRRGAQASVGGGRQTSWGGWRSSRRGWRERRGARPKTQDGYISRQPTHVRPALQGKRRKNSTGPRRSESTPGPPRGKNFYDRDA